MKIKLRGTLFATTFETLSKVLGDFWGEGLKSKVRIFGEEIHYSNDQLSFYCYSSLENLYTDNRQNFLVDGEHVCEDNEFATFLNNFISALNRSEIVYEFEHVRESIEGLALEEETIIRHPEYIKYWNNSNELG